MNDFKITPVGYVSNSFNEPIDYHEIKKHQSTIVILEEYSEALLNIENSQYLDIVFYFHKSDEVHLSGNIHSGEMRGVFASRSPKRPNKIGITTVSLVERTGNTLVVNGLDAINDTPVIDIKCCDTSVFENQQNNNQVHLSLLKASPRLEINNHIANNDLHQLLIKAGQLHGHFCPGLAMGVMAANYTMNTLKAESDGMEDLLAIVETNNCFSDGIQYVTGCSFGNNSLVYKDLGKTAFTLTLRNGKGIRVCSKHESQEIIKNAFPKFSDIFQRVIVEKNHAPELVAEFKKESLQRAFGTLNIAFERLFSIKEVNVEIPSYANIHDSVVCICCHESVMKTRTEKVGEGYKCLSCLQPSRYNMLDGNGMHILCNF